MEPKRELASDVDDDDDFTDCEKGDDGSDDDGVPFITFKPKVLENIRLVLPD